MLLSGVGLPSSIALVGAQAPDEEEVQLARRAIDAKSSVADRLLLHRHRKTAADAETADDAVADKRRAAAASATDYSNVRTLWDALAVGGDGPVRCATCRDERVMRLDRETERDE